MKIQEALKNFEVEATVDVEEQLIVLKVFKKIEHTSERSLVSKSAFNIKKEKGVSFNDYWNTIRIEGVLYDFNLTYEEGTECSVLLYGFESQKVPSAENYMVVPINFIVEDNGNKIEIGKTELEKKFIRDNAEDVLLRIFSIIPMDKPENFEDILNFVVDDVYVASASNEGYISEGDIIIAFRRFIESK